MRDDVSWTTRKQSARCSRQTTTPTPHHSIFTGQTLFLMCNQQCQSTEGQYLSQYLQLSPLSLMNKKLAYIVHQMNFSTPPPTAVTALSPQHTFKGPFSGTTRVGRYQKGKTNLDFTEARNSEWQWHQLGHTQVCTSLQTDNHASTSPLSFFYRPDALPATQPTASKRL